MKIIKKIYIILLFTLSINNNFLKSNPHSLKEKIINEIKIFFNNHENMKKIKIIINNLPNYIKINFELYTKNSYSYEVDIHEEYKEEKSHSNFKSKSTSIGDSNIKEIKEIKEIKKNILNIIQDYLDELEDSSNLNFKIEGI